MTRLELLASSIVSARAYTVRLLDAVPADQWFAMPGGVSHIAWQVGHLAMAEYRLGLERQRGKRPGDEALISTAFLELFGRNSVADADPAVYPAVGAIRAVFDAVHQRLLEELADADDAGLDGPPASPHAIARTKLACLQWCAAHESLHAGQIGLLRRQIGHAPLW